MPELKLEFGLWGTEPNTTALRWIESSTDPAKINAMLQQVENGAQGDGHVSLHRDVVYVDFNRGTYWIDPELQGVRKGEVYFETGETYVVSIADFESLKRDVLAACETMAANKTVKRGLRNLSLDGSVDKKARHSE
jgi:hypothetical protein